MGGNMQKMMKQIQKMQAEIERIQLELGNDRVEGTAGGGAVRAVADGHQSFVEIHIDPAAVDPDDVEMLQDLVMAACNEAIRKSKQLAESKMAKVTGSISVPGLKL
ncbi:MAG: YbaB/EbfC family nucleoid-associated protein [Bacillota bacterium]|jgi:DNA-binding YbaB/EbfC family protein|nr:YbaB/EbfC family nucleoid-associated protein [Bacillota bacterium]